MKRLTDQLQKIKSLQLPFKIQQREKIALWIAAAAVLVFILIQGVITPILDRRGRLEREIKASTVKLQEMLAMKAEMERLSKSTQGSEEKLKQRSKAFTLFSFLDTLAGNTGLKQHIEYMKPSTSNLKNSPYVLSMVELKLQSLTMEQLVNFLHGIESSNEHIWIKRMSIAKGEKEQGLITSVLHVETFQL